MAIISEKAPTWIGYIFTAPITMFLLPAISGGFSDNDYREVVRNFMPFIIIYALNLISFFLFAIIMELREMNAKTKEGRGD